MAKREKVWNFLSDALEDDLRRFRRSLEGRPKHRVPQGADANRFLDQSLERTLSMITGRLAEIWRPRNSWDPFPEVGLTDWTLLAVALLRMGDLIEDAHRARRRGR